MCFSAPASMALIPCGHKALCAPCCAHIRADSGRCPVCRTQIDSAIHVHDAGVTDEAPAAPPAHAQLARAISVTVAPSPASAGRRPLALSLVSSTPPTAGGSSDRVVVHIDVPEDSTTRLGADIVIAIDVSGSMGREATFEDAGGAVRSDGLSVLDVARHGVRVVAALLKVRTMSPTSVLE